MTDAAHPTIMRDFPILPSVDWTKSAAFLDFDGTLVDFAPRPEDVRLADTERDLLNSLYDRCNGAVAILSGRDLDSLRPHLQGLPVIRSGSHGAQIEIDGIPSLAAGAGEGIETAFRILKPIADDSDLLIERKAAAIALHYRARPEMECEVKANIDRLASEHAELKAVHGKLVSELASNAYNKGTALLQLGDHPQFAGRIPVAVGDDTTDEDMFKAARSIGGLGIRIGPGPTAANYRFETRRNFVTWLAQSLELC